MNHFRASGEELLACLGELAALARERQQPGLANYLEQQAQKLRDNRFHLVVLGAFKRGKTTFLNALLGQDILPTAVVPLTSIVTLLEYGEHLHIQVVFKDGATRSISQEELPGYITEEGNPKNEKNVRHVQVKYPSDYLKDGLVLIDTPGVGSIYQNNDDETYQYLPQMDAAIFLLTVDPPISQAETDFLERIKPYAARTFFILNKIDYLDEQGLRQALEFSRRVLAERVHLDRPVLCPLSARLALQGKISGSQELLEKSGLPQFDRSLRQFLMEEKGRAILEAAVTKALGAAAELQLHLRLELKALHTPLQELVEKIGQFDRALGEMYQEQQDHIFILEGEINKLLRETEAAIGSFREEKTRELQREIDRLNEEKTNLFARELAETIKQAVNEQTEKFLSAWQPELEKDTLRKYEQIVNRFVAKTNRLLDDVVRQAAEIFAIPVEGFSKLEIVPGKDPLFLSIGEEISTMFYVDPMKVQVMLPRFLSGPVIVRELKRRAEEQLDKNCGRIRHYLAEKVWLSSQQFKLSLEDKIRAASQGTREALERAVTLKQASEPEVRVAAATLEEAARKLDEIKHKLLTIKENINTIT